TATGSDTCVKVAITFTDTLVPGCGNTKTITRHLTYTTLFRSITTGDQTVTVVDTTRPSLTVPPSTTVECTGDTSPAATGTATGREKWGTAAIPLTDTVVPGCGNTKTITRHWKATDACGNITTG